MDMQSLIDALRRVDAKAYGNSGGFVGTDAGEGPAYMPAMAGGRLGYRDGGLDAGVSGSVVRLPDGRVMRQMGPVDVGYSVPFMGGKAGVKASVNPKGGYDARLTYRQEF